MAARVRSGAPRWMAAGALVATAATAGPSAAHADEGAVVLRSGGRAQGTILVVLPNDRVVVRIADGTTMTFPWSDVERVTDGPRIYDSSGDVSEPAPTVPAATPPPAVDAPMPGPVRAPPAPLAWNDVRAIQLEYTSLPGRGGTVALGVFGGILMAGGGLDALFGGLIGCYDDYGSACGIRNVMIGTGLVSGAAGALMTAFATRRAHRRSVGVHDLRERGFLVSEHDEAPTLRISVDFAPGGVGGPSRMVPSLTLRF